MTSLLTLAHQYLHSFLCHPIRSNFDLALKGGLDYLDGLVFTDLCDQAKRLSSLWKLYHKKNPFYYNLSLPKRLDTIASKEYLAWELKRFKRALEGFIGREISEEDIKQSIKLYNECRALLRRLYRFKEGKDGHL